MNIYNQFDKGNIQLSELDAYHYNFIEIARHEDRTLEVNKEEEKDIIFAMLGKKDNEQHTPKRNTKKGKR
jgi:hypothetical protein